MTTSTKASNRLIKENSPYLLQHADNPVDWWPWCEEAFAAARAEQKPVFLSIGYATCHWCHVMAEESFENPDIARILNENFVSIKVDKQERPDIDSVYMAVCQAYTGSGGWPMSVFMTPEQKPFFAGTYFPPQSRNGLIGFGELLLLIADRWHENRGELIAAAESIIGQLQVKPGRQGDISDSLIRAARDYFGASFDADYGGFGRAPKFPAAHNLLFLLSLAEHSADERALEMVELTLRQMYRGGIFDQIGGGFCRYSTDRYFLAPHFEKMLYDNALLIMAYAEACRLTGDQVYNQAASRTAAYALRELAEPQGGFFAAQDADSEGVEGKFYLISYDEIIAALGREAGKKFAACYDITRQGNFEGGNIPNLLHTPLDDPRLAELAPQLEKLRQFREERYHLRLDDQILTAWNSLMIAALAELSRSLDAPQYLDAARRAERFIADKLCDGDTLHVNYRAGKLGGPGFLDDYAAYIYALLKLYQITLEQPYLTRAQQLADKVLRDFAAPAGGFYLSGGQNERLVLQPQETADGAIPSGNSLMAHNLLVLAQLSHDGQGQWQEAVRRQMLFMSAAAADSPSFHSFFLLALADYLDPPPLVVCVLAPDDSREDLLRRIPRRAAVILRESPSEQYPLKDNRSTYYVCRGHSCRPASNDLEEALS
ncbi:MAG: thioredoxin domain-containing protein [Clostridia bacterium]|nr:thioredoxin domain-containing protein [Clostridia bacterium]